MTGPMTPAGIRLQKGQQWKERDGRFERIVTVLDWMGEPIKVQIKAVRVTWASIARFNDKSGGYGPIQP